MKLRSILILFISLYLASCSYCKTFIIVPGTWSIRSKWHKPDGDFFKSLQTTAHKHNAHVISFIWPAKNKHTCREDAAKKLAELILQHEDVCIVAHSHGSNVGILASHILARQGHKQRISSFFALATPVSPAYLPNMEVIGHFYNLFSITDIFQTGLGAFTRVYPPAERIFNIRVTINGKSPTHSKIHHPTVGSWIPLLPTALCTDEKKSIDLTIPSLIHFHTDKAPCHEYDDEIEDLLEQDARFQAKLAIAFHRSRHINEKEDE